MTNLTLNNLIRGRSTLDQLLILGRADRLLWDSCGRYYGGFLSENQIAWLIEGLR